MSDAQPTPRLRVLPREKFDVPDTERVRVALHDAIEDYNTDLARGLPPRGVAVIFLSEKPDKKSFSVSWRVEGMSRLETVGLLTSALADMNTDDRGDYLDDEPQGEGQ